MNKLTYIFCLLTIALSSFAQERPGKREQADLLFERYEYARSLGLYLPLARKANADVKLIERVAACYRLMNKYPEAEQWYERAVANSMAENSSILYYAEVLLNNQKFDAAKAQFKKYYSETKDATELNKRLSSIDSATAWMRQEPGYKVENFYALNTPRSDWGLNFYGTSGLVLVSDRNLREGTYNWTGNGWLKPYLATSTGKMLGELPLPLPLQSHVGPVAFTSSEDTAYVTVSTTVAAETLPVEKTSHQALSTRRLEILVAVKHGGKWIIAGKFPYNNVKEYSVGHAVLAQNGNVLYFTSDMPGGEGKTDIWYSEKLPDGSWTKPVNCGKAINTSEEEAFPTTSKGKLYFSSKASGMGGHDIFSAVGARSTWTAPVNLKYPINSTADDFFLSTLDGVSGYFSSDRAGGAGNDDIYKFNLLPQQTPAKTPELNNPHGLPPDGRLQPGKTYVLKNIYYDLDKAEIRPDAARELDRLFEILKQNPGIRIELSSHTDSRASDAYNLKLSQRRAEAAVKYLWDKGISAERLIPKGYGETRLVNKCADGIECTEEEHQANRRTEIQVLE
ncbi:MAG: hypothetical protein K0S09_1452 [Sphingobacteriaceae bacterium]|jgi:outer membrane protein OmpA-like peptidoglycan-associated protein|nr:hypothetical protein [Sphingobacteriaceae bacterium]